MASTFEKFTEANSKIDAIFETLGQDAGKPASERILDFAKRGIDAPEALSHKEVQQICYALVVHYAHRDII